MSGCGHPPYLRRVIHCVPVANTPVGTVTITDPTTGYTYTGGVWHLPPLVETAELFFDGTRWRKLEKTT